MKRLFQVLVLLATLALLAAAPAVHGTPARASLPDIEDEVMCPTCGVALNQAFSPQAERERDFIRQQIASGSTKDEIKQALVREFGVDVLALPNPGDRGINWGAYLIPALVLILGIAAVAFGLARWRRRATLAAGVQATPDLSPADADRLDHDLARYDL